MMFMTDGIEMDAKMEGTGQVFAHSGGRASPIASTARAAATATTSSAISAGCSGGWGI